MRVTGVHLLRATLAGIARLEAAGAKPVRLTEPDFAQWARFRRKLGWADFVRLLHEDAAESFPEPFDVARWGLDPFEELEEGTAQMLVGDAARSSPADGVDFLAEQARGLGLPAGGAISSLPRVQAREKVLEPGARPHRGGARATRTSPSPAGRARGRPSRSSAIGSSTGSRTTGSRTPRRCGCSARARRAAGRTSSTTASSRRARGSNARSARSCNRRCVWRKYRSPPSTVNRPTQGVGRLRLEEPESRPLRSREDPLGHVSHPRQEIGTMRATTVTRLGDDPDNIAIL